VSLNRYLYSKPYSSDLVTPTLHRKGCSPGAHCWHEHRSEVLLLFYAEISVTGTGLRHLLSCPEAHPLPPLSSRHIFDQSPP